MALQTSITLPSGIELPAAYSRIGCVYHQHAATTVNVQTWASAAARQANLEPVSSQPYSLPWTDGVSISGAYTALKALPEFANAVDV